MKILLFSFLAVFSLQLSVFSQAITDLGEALRSAKAQHKRCIIVYSRGGALGGFNQFKRLIEEKKIAIPDSEYVVAEPDMRDRVQRYLYDSVNTVFPSLGEDKRAPQIVITDEEGRIIAARGGVNTAEKYEGLLAAATQVKGMEDHDLAKALSKVDVSGTVESKDVKTDGETGRDFYRYGQKIMSENLRFPLAKGGTGTTYDLYGPADGGAYVAAQIRVDHRTDGTKVTKQSLRRTEGVSLFYVDKDGDGRDDQVRLVRYLDRTEMPRFELDEAYSINSKLEVSPLSAEEFARERVSPDLQ